MNRLFAATNLRRDLDDASSTYWLATAVLGFIGFVFAALFPLLFLPLVGWLLYRVAHWRTVKREIRAWHTAKATRKADEARLRALRKF